MIVNKFQGETIEDFENRLIVHPTTIKQLHKGKFISEHIEFVFDKSWLTKRKSILGFHADFEVGENNVLLVFPLSGSQSVVGGMPVRHEAINVYFPGEKISSFNQAIDVYLINIKVDKLANFITESNFEIWAEKVKELRRQSLTEDSKSKYHNQIQKLFQSALELEQVDNIEETNSKWSELENTLCETVASLSTEYEFDGRNVNPKNRNRIIVQAIEMITEDPLKQWNTHQIAIECHCSVRTLEYSFRNILQSSVKQVIIGLRLNTIYRELLAADPQTQSLSSIYKKFGIINSSRFNRDYKNFFDQPPIDTLERVT